MTQAIRDARTQRAALLNSNPTLTLNVFKQLKREQGRTPHVEDQVLDVCRASSPAACFRPRPAASTFPLP
jgi:hypothetical protein